MLVRLAYKLLKLVLSKDLSLAERNLFTTLILDKLDASPLSDIIKVDEEGNLFINGSPTDMEMAKVLYAHANMALDNKADQLITRQIEWVSIVEGLHNGDTPEKLLFYRAAIWFNEQRKGFLHLLAQRDQRPEL